MKRYSIGKEKPSNINYEIKDGKIIIGKKKHSPLMMNISGFIIEFLSGVLMINAIIGFIQYKSNVSILYFLAGGILFYIGIIYRRVSREALGNIKNNKEV